ncbi:MAG: HNH endonuclease [Acidobacteria bacterium]|nr:HNH endonuclease [Acidobacteriota bacterium]
MKTALVGRESRLRGSRCRTFCSDRCVCEWRIRSDVSYTRELVWTRDRGVCQRCLVDLGRAEHRWREARSTTRSRRALRAWRAARPRWEVDHIVPVADGGGECGLANLRLLCRPCHVAVTQAWSHRRRNGATANPRMWRLAPLRPREVVLGHEHAADPERRRRFDHQAEPHLERIGRKRKERLGAGDLAHPGRRVHVRLATECAHDAGDEPFERARRRERIPDHLPALVVRAAPEVVDERVDGALIRGSRGPRLSQTFNRRHRRAPRRAAACGPAAAQSDKTARQCPERRRPSSGPGVPPASARRRRLPRSGRPRTSLRAACDRRPPTRPGDRTIAIARTSRRRG